MNITLTSFPKDSNWVKGIIDDTNFEFEAKLYDEDSEYGIDDGRISKLNVYDKVLFEKYYEEGKTTWDAVIINYDRGWDIKPKKEYKDIYNAIINFLENAPKRFS